MPKTRLDPAARAKIDPVWELIYSRAASQKMSYERLADQIDYMRLAEYLLRQVRRIPNAKKFLTSRNLIRPEPKDRIALSDAELRVPKGGKLLLRSEYRPGGPQYMRCMLPKEKWRRPEKRE